jgi:replicative DNA helicase
LSDLRDSGTIEQDADWVLMLYRPDYYRERKKQDGETYVYVRKNREGPIGQFMVCFEPTMMTFDDWTRPSRKQRTKKK